MDRKLSTGSVIAPQPLRDSEHHQRLALGLVVFLVIACSLTAAVLIALSRQKSKNDRGCRQHADCPGVQICSIGDDGAGMCVDSGCATVADRDKCGGMCAYASNDGSLGCSCDGGNSFSLNSCPKCTGTAAQAYVAAGGCPHDHSVGSFVFCRNGKFDWARHARDPTDAMPLYNSADKTADAKYCVSSLTDPNFSVTACQPGQHCHKGRCVEHAAPTSVAGRLQRMSPAARTASVIVAAVLLAVAVGGVAMGIASVYRRDYEDEEGSIWSAETIE